MRLKEREVYTPLDDAILRYHVEIPILTFQYRSHALRIYYQEQIKELNDTRRVVS
jgi:hypothetical protein